MPKFIWWRQNGRLQPQIWYEDRRGCWVESGYGPSAARYFAEHIAAEHDLTGQGPEFSLDWCIKNFPPPAGEAYVPATVGEKNFTRLSVNNLDQLRAWNREDYLTRFAELPAPLMPRS